MLSGSIEVISPRPLTILFSVHCFQYRKYNVGNPVFHLIYGVCARQGFEVAYPFLTILLSIFVRILPVRISPIPIMKRQTRDKTVWKSIIWFARGIFQSWINSYPLYREGLSLWHLFFLGSSISGTPNQATFRRKKKLKREDFKKVQNNFYSLRAGKIISCIKALEPESEPTARALEILKRWDRNMDAESGETAVYELFLTALMRNLGTYCGDVSGWSFERSCKADGKR